MMGSQSILKPNESVTYLQDVPLPGMMIESQAPAESYGHCGQDQFSNGTSSDDGLIVEGRWVQPGENFLMNPWQPPQLMHPVHEETPEEVMHFEKAPPPVIARPLPWLPSRNSERSDSEPMDKEMFIQKLDDVCGRFQAPEVDNTHMQEVNGTVVNIQMEAAFTAAEEALTELVEQSVMNGPIRHMAICVMARRVVMLAESIRNGSNTSSGGKRLMVALLTAVKQIAAANTGEVAIHRGEGDKFSGRVILLLGSAMCTKDQLLKQCGDRYRNLDPHCLVLALSMGSEPSGSAQLGEALNIAVTSWADAVTKHGPPGTAGGAGRPELMVHLFGSAGFAAWSQLLRIWDEQAHFPDAKRIKCGQVMPMASVLRGVVLDSAPGDKGQSRLGALPLVQGDASLLSAMTGYAADGSEEQDMSKMQASQAAMRELTARDGPVWQYYSEIAEKELLRSREVHAREPAVPLMFIYSGSDRIAPADIIERYIMECEGRLSQDPQAHNVPVPRRLRLEKGSHVGHRSGQEKDEYWRAVSDFWRLALFC